MWTAWVSQANARSVIAWKKSVATLPRSRIERKRGTTGGSRLSRLAKADGEEAMLCGKQKNRKRFSKRENRTVERFSNHDRLY